jgi:hypothetical protein
MLGRSSVLQLLYERTVGSNEVVLTGLVDGVCRWVCCVTRCVCCARCAVHDPQDRPCWAALPRWQRQRPGRPLTFLAACPQERLRRGWPALCTPHLQFDLVFLAIHHCASWQSIIAQAARARDIHLLLRPPQLAADADRWGWLLCSARLALWEAQPCSCRSASAAVPRWRS